jgi:hypothetical protein
MIDPKLLDYCATDRQREIIQAVLEHGSANKAAKAMGANRRWIDETVLRVKGHAARQGWGPEYDLTHQIAPGQICAAPALCTALTDKSKRSGS